MIIHFLVGPVSLNYGYLPFPCYRRMTPEEDLLATQQGIDLLVKQRQALVDKLVIHHNQLSRTNEKESLLQFSRQIDSIMRYVSYIWSLNNIISIPLKYISDLIIQDALFRMRGFSIMPSPNPAKFHRDKRLQNKTSGNNKIERGVTFDWKWIFRRCIRNKLHILSIFWNISTKLCRHAEFVKCEI